MGRNKDLFETPTIGEIKQRRADGIKSNRWVEPHTFILSSGRGSGKTTFSTYMIMRWMVDKSIVYLDIEGTGPVNEQVDRLIQRSI